MRSRASRLRRSSSSTNNLPGACESAHSGGAQHQHRALSSPSDERQEGDAADAQLLQQRTRARDPEQPHPAIGCDVADGHRPSRADDASDERVGRQVARDGFSKPRQAGREVSYDMNTRIGANPAIFRDDMKHRPVGGEGDRQYPHHLEKLLKPHHGGKAFRDRRQKRQRVALLDERLLATGFSALPFGNLLSQAFVSMFERGSTLLHTELEFVMRSPERVLLLSERPLGRDALGDVDCVAEYRYGALPASSNSTLRYIHTRSLPLRAMTRIKPASCPLARMRCR